MHVSKLHSRIEKWSKKAKAPVAKDPVGGVDGCPFKKPLDVINERASISSTTRSSSSGNGKADSLKTLTSLHSSSASLTSLVDSNVAANGFDDAAMGSSMMMESHGHHASGSVSMCPFLAAGAANNSDASSTMQLKQLKTGNKIKVELSEQKDSDKPWHTVGCTPHECHGAMMEKNGFGPVGDSYDPPVDVMMEEAVAFLKQFAAETGMSEHNLQERIQDVENKIHRCGLYQHTTEELKFGCRLAWCNSGRCIMRKVAMSLELRDCRSVETAKECFEEVVEHLKYAANGGAIKPVISIFPQKRNGTSAKVRVWNRQILGYAAYKRKDGTVMGDPVNLDFTALCCKLGWVPPSTKSDFDILPVVISDVVNGHDCPRLFEIPSDATLEVPIHHPEHEMFSALNL